MSTIAVKDSTKAQHAEAIEATVALVLSGKSRDLTRMAKSVSEAEVSALVEAGRYLSHREGQAVRGLAVITYTLLNSGAFTVSQDLADAIGVSPSRVTQLRKEGEVIVTLGLPEGWRKPVSLTQVRALTQGKGSKELGEFLKDETLKVNDKRDRIAGVVARLTEEAAQAKATAKANREAEAKAKADKASKGENNAPEVSKAPAGTDVTDAVLATAVTDLAMIAATLSRPGIWDRLSTKQQQSVAASVGKMVAAQE